MPSTNENDWYNLNLGAVAPDVSSVSTEATLARMRRPARPVGPKITLGDIASGVYEDVVQRAGEARREFPNRAMNYATNLGADPFGTVSKTGAAVGKFAFDLVNPAPDVVESAKSWKEFATTPPDTTYYEPYAPMRERLFDPLTKTAMAAMGVVPYVKPLTTGAKTIRAAVNAARIGR